MLERRESLGGECFAEAYIEGREFNVSLLGDASGVEVLPIAEMCFDKYETRPKVLGYDAKWTEGSFAYEHTARTFEVAPEDKDLVRQLSRIAIKCWKLFRLRGYARVDFRVDAQGEPYVLEVNANPCISPDGGFIAAASQARISYDNIISRIIADCPLQDKTT
jgi:D-alanine-D-alanine ligase